MAARARAKYGRFAWLQLFNMLICNRYKLNTPVAYYERQFRARSLVAAVIDAAICERRLHLLSDCQYKFAPFYNLEAVELAAIFVCVARL